MDRALLGSTEVAYYLNLQKKMLFQLVNAGKIPHVRIGKPRRFVQADIMKANPIKRTCPPGAS